MLKETSLFFGSIIKEDRSILDLIDADYTFLNEPLGPTLRHRRHQRQSRLAKAGRPGRLADQRRKIRPGASGQPHARRGVDAGERAGRHVQPDADFAGEARQIRPGSDPGRSAPPPPPNVPELKADAKLPSPALASRSAWSSIGPIRIAPIATSTWTESASRLKTFNAIGGVSLEGRPV